MAPTAPVLLHHARRDQIVSFAHSVNPSETTGSGSGGDVRLYVTRGGVDHISGAVAGSPARTRLAEPASRAGCSGAAAGRERRREAAGREAA